MSFPTIPPWLPISTRWAGPSPRLCAVWHWTSGHGAGNMTSFLWPATCPGTRTSLQMLCPGEPPSPDGVDPPQRSDQSDLLTLAKPACGPVRVGEEPQAASVLLNPAVPVIERCERADAELGMPLQICVSTDGTPPESVAEVEASTNGPDPTGGPVLAQPAVVPPTDIDADGSATGDLPEGQSPEERGHGDAVPKTGGHEVNCMASVRKSFVDRGFSANVADTAARARRESTRRVYGSRL